VGGAMKLIITTVYENVDEKWLKWWLSNRIPEIGLVNELIENGEAIYISSDPSSKVIGKTEYQILKE